MAAANPRSRGSIGGDVVSDTPRTDLEEWQYTNEDGEEWSVVESDFARQLERELAAVTAERDTLDKDARSLSDLLQDCRALFNCIATDDNSEEFQIDQNFRKQLDRLSNLIKTTT